MRWVDNRLLDVAAVLLAAVGVVRLVRVLPTRITQNDFAHYYVTSRLAWDGRDPFMIPLEPAYRELGFAYEPEIPHATNPPTVQWLFLPLALLPVQIAFWLWVGVETASLVVVLWLTRQLLREQLSPHAWRLVYAAAIGSAAVYWHFYYSQLQLLLAALVLAALAWHRRGWQATACLTITAAGLLKLYPLVLLPWFLWRSRQRLRIIWICVALAVAVVVATRPVRWLDFVRHGIPVLTKDALNRTFNYAVPAFVANVACSTRGFVLPDPSLRGWWICGSGAALLILVGAYGAIWRGNNNHLVEFALLNVAMIVASAKSGHYLVFAILPMAVGAAHANSVRSRLCLAAVYIMLNLFATCESPWLNKHLTAKVLANYFPLYGLLALGVYLALELRRTKSA